MKISDTNRTAFEESMFRGAGLATGLIAAIAVGKLGDAALSGVAKGCRWAASKLRDRREAKQQVEATTPEQVANAS